MEVAMPLSEHEQRVLEQMERALSAEDPRLVSTLTGAGSAERIRSRLGLAVALVLLGIGTLLGGLIAKLTFVGVIGFALALAGIYLAISGAKAPKMAKRNHPSARATFIQRLEERWDHREEQ
jgi:uncharacterized membrane protein HdeD (DUF308 family)